MRRTVIVWAAVLALAPFAAQAKNVYVGPENYHLETQQSISILAEAGFSRFDRSLAAQTEIGPSYGARLELAANRNVTLDLVYMGSLNNMNSIYSADGMLMSNQIGADIRVNFVPPNYDLPGRLRPFVFGGIAYQRITTQNFTPGITDANAGAAPVGAGIEADVLGRMVLGGRFTYNFLFNTTDNFPNGHADLWVASVSLGARVWP